MDDQAIMAELTDIFRDLFGDDSIVLAPETMADDVEGWDSIKHISLIVAVEDHWNIKMKTSEIDTLKNVGDLQRVVAAKIG
ncbi:acyl carrier protein [Sphingomonas sp. BIUV-7]|uniref:Acyl carrier protein n=1 Tax=Sphingomonas natans TaxID=3063330 RepID=A0ABT8Y5S4_9SPHN|nr:acyl carrier protein [Sphingomonas sp. BIUV-7]MDO6413678.1 acyl carrier protein [Sphingomonas sp. BIUV-7]